ncbi:unnamed protein product [Protopolystoma xenopodis]|uniref:TIL domain-containing protein n=1 Tax=Protopolystoma xenopodis TaxID=117903 RepID=A0A3S5AVA7_9PLAT|nr:unnamed protein product [Protopolystoma xenopodis]
MSKLEPCMSDQKCCEPGTVFDETDTCPSTCEDLRIAAMKSAERKSVPRRTCAQNKCVCAEGFLREPRSNGTCVSTARCFDCRLTNGTIVLVGLS